MYPESAKILSIIYIQQPESNQKTF